MEVSDCISSQTGFLVEDTPYQGDNKCESDLFELTYGVSENSFYILWICVFTPCEGIGHQIIEGVRDYCLKYGLTPVAVDVMDDAEGFWNREKFYPDRNYPDNWIAA